MGAQNPISMKKCVFLSLCVMAAATAQARVSDNADVTPTEGPATFEEYTLPTEGGKYDPNTADGTTYWQSGDYKFPATSSWSGMMHDGFYPANYTDTTYTSYTDDYKAITCCAQEGNNYCSFYYGGSYGGATNICFTARELTGTYVTMALNPYLCINGRSWCSAFKDGDYLCLHVEGKKEGVLTGTTADFYLADYRDGKSDVVNTWQWFDLSALGTIDELVVSMLDSQNGAGVGLYCCFDNFGAESPTGLESLHDAPSSTAVKKVLLDGKLYIVRNGQLIKM